MTLDCYLPFGEIYEPMHPEGEETLLSPTVSGFVAVMISSIAGNLLPFTRFINIYSILTMTLQFPQVKDILLYMTHNYSAGYQISVGDELGINTRGRSYKQQQHGHQNVSNRSHLNNEDMNGLETLGYSAGSQISDGNELG